MDNKKENNLSNQENNELGADGLLCDEVKKSIETIILYRSLYILKKKFELKKSKIRALYNSFNIDKNSNVALLNSYQVNIENFVIICETIFKECNILLTTLTNPKDIFLSNIFLNIKRKKNEMNSILNDIKIYITDENNSLVKKYNTLFYEKKIKPNLIKNIIEVKQNISNTKINYKNNKSSYFESNQINKNINENINIKIIEKEKEIKELNDNDEEEEIHRAIVEYNRKGKIIKTFNRLANDNLTLSVSKDNEKRKKIKIVDKERIKYFQLNNNNDFVGSYMQNIIENKNSIEIINEKEENYNLENDEKNKTISMCKLLNIENDQNYNNILYIETLPLIIADYMQQFPFYCIIETESDLTNELNILFDKELIEKMNNYEEALKQKNENYISKEIYKYEQNKIKIEKGIKIYENLITEKKIKGENTFFLENMLEKLLAKNIIIQDKISQLKTENNNNTLRYEASSKYEHQDNNITNNMEYNNISRYSNMVVKHSESNILNHNEYNKIRVKEKLTISQLNTNLKHGRKNTKTRSNIKTEKTNGNKKIFNSIKDIFNFYSRQHNSVGSNGLFADVEKNMEHLTSSEFNRFCSEFNIPIIRQKSYEIYKKSLSIILPTSEDKSQLMNLDAFLIALKFIAKDIHQNKLNLLLSNIKQEKSKLDEIETKKIRLKEIEKFNNSINNNNISVNSNNKNKFDKGEFYFESEKKKIMNSIFNSENKYNNEKNKTEEEIMNNFYMYIGINEKNEYKSKMKGFLLPFRTREKQKNLMTSKNEIGSRLEFEMKEANKIYMMQKNEKKKLVLSKEALEKQLYYKEKQKMFKIKNEKLYNHIEKRYNKKYADKLSEFKNKITKKKLEIMKIRDKEEFEKKNLISWNKLEDFDINNLDIDENEKKIFIESDNSDEEIINQISNESKINTNKYGKKLNKNYSAIDLVSKNNIHLPPIKQKSNLQGNNNVNDIINNNNNEFNDILFNDNNNMKKEETNNFSNLSDIMNDNQNIST